MSDVQSEVPVLEDEVECRSWLEAIYLQMSHYTIMERVREINALVSTLTREELASWVVAEKRKLVDLDSAYRLNTAALARAQKLINRGRSTPFGAALTKTKIDQDHRLISWISAQARPVMQEAI